MDFWSSPGPTSAQRWASFKVSIGSNTNCYFKLIGWKMLIKLDIPYTQRRDQPVVSWDTLSVLGHLIKLSKASSAWNKMDKKKITLVKFTIDNLYCWSLSKIQFYLCFYDQYKNCSRTLHGHQIMLSTNFCHKCIWMVFPGSHQLYIAWGPSNTQAQIKQCKCDE